MYHSPLYCLKQKNSCKCNVYLVKDLCSICVMLCSETLLYDLKRINRVIMPKKIRK